MFCSLLLFIASFYWLVEANIYFAQSHLWAVCLVFLGLCAWLSIPYLVLSYCYAKFKWRQNVWGPVLAAATLTLAWLVTPTPLPWLPLNSLYLYPKFIAILDLSGISMLLFLSTLFCFSAEYVFRKNSPYSKHYWALLLTIPIAMLGYGELRQWQLENNKANAKDNQWLNIGYIQPSLMYSDSFETAYHITEQLIERDAPDLIVWPETAAPFSLINNREDQINMHNLVTKHRQDLLVSSGYVYVEDKPRFDGNDLFFNQSQLIKDRKIAGIYSKEILVPFFEYMPSKLKILRKWMSGVLYYKAGELQESVRYKDVNLILAICYESIFPEFVRKKVSREGGIMVNQVSDTIFDSGIGHYYHYATAYFRVIENRMPWVRAANTGISVIVDRNGRELTEVPQLNSVGFDSAKVFVPKNASVYGLFGDSFKYVLLLGLCVNLLFCWFKKGRQG